MSTSLLLSLIAQALTLLHRNQKASEVVSDVLAAPAFILACVFAVVIHTGYVSMKYDAASHRALKAALVGPGGWLTVVALLIMPVLGALVGFATNHHDEASYRRYCQFLRLEFDTKLGMHSPR